MSEEIKLEDTTNERNDHLRMTIEATKSLSEDGNKFAQAFSGFKHRSPLTHAQKAEDSKPLGKAGIS